MVYVLELGHLNLQVTGFVWTNSMEIMLQFLRQHDLMIYKERVNIYEDEEFDEYVELLDDMYYDKEASELTTVKMSSNKFSDVITIYSTFGIIAETATHIAYKYCDECNFGCSIIETSIPLIDTINDIISNMTFGDIFEYNDLECREDTKYDRKYNIMDSSEALQQLCYQTRESFDHNELLPITIETYLEFFRILLTETREEIHV